MASAAVIAAVKSRQRNFWTTTPFLYPNEPYPLPNNPASFVAVEFPLAESDQASLGAPGANKFRDLGAIRFVINTPNDIGTDLGTQYANELSNVFRAKVFDGVITYAPSPPVYLGADGNYASWSISVPYKYDHQE
jgi:hypothetical protein